MITVHKLNGEPLVVNAELIESLEPGAQTVIALATGNRYLVREKADEVVEKVIEYRKKVNAHSGAVNPIKGFERMNS